MSEDLTWLPAWRLRELIGAREVSCQEVLEHFLGRIEELDGELHSISYLDQGGARLQADAADRALARGETVGPLCGIPTAIKQHIAVAGMPTVSMASTTTKVARRDDFGVERLRSAGAIIVGTNTMMGAGASRNEGSFGFNWEVEARNPWDTTKVPGWSSSGGAASAAAALLPFTIGSDGGGSTRLPAAYSGVVGVHPTRGLVPNTDYESPTVPVSGETIGPLSRSVRDAALVTQIMAGPDGRDPFCWPLAPGDFLAEIDAGVEGWRFAWTGDFGFASRYSSPDSGPVIAAVRTAAHGLGVLGATVEATDVVWEDIWPHHLRTTAAFTDKASRGAPKTSLAELQESLELRARNYQRFASLLGEVDVLLSPTAQRVARSVEEWNAAWTVDGAKYPHGSFAPTYTSHTYMFNWLQFPALSVPCGFVDGLPVGLQFIGQPGSEARLFRAAHAFQTAFPRLERPPITREFAS